MKPNETGLTRIISAFGYSMKGIAYTWKNEAAFRQEVSLCAVLVPLAFILANSSVERALLIGSCLFILIIELLNSAIEAVVDRISDEQHILSGAAKDIGSATVLFSFILTSVVWLIILVG